MWYKSVIPIWNHLKILQFIPFQKPGFWFIEIDTKFIGEIWSGGSQKKWLHAIPNPESQIFMIFHDYLLSYIIRIMLKMRNSGKFGIRDRKLVKECGEQLLCIIESKILILFFLFIQGSYEERCLRSCLRWCSWTYCRHQHQKGCCCHPEHGLECFQVKIIEFFLSFLVPSSSYFNI